MTDTINHIICGGAGQCLGEITIVIYDHQALNVAVNLKHANLAALFELQGMPTARAHRKAMRYGKRIQRFWDDLYADLEADGIDTNIYEPHAENLAQVPQPTE